MKKKVLISLAVATVIASPTLQAGGVIGDFVKSVGRVTGVKPMEKAGEELDNAHREIKKSVPVYGAAEEGVTHVFKELTVETGGPALAQWIRASRNNAVSAGTHSIPADVRVALRGFFPDDLMDRVSYRVGRGNELSLQNNAFEFGHAAAITLEDVIVFKSNSDAHNNALLWAHELAHVQQYERWGLNDFAKRYVRGVGSVEREADEVEQRFLQWATDQDQS